MSAAIINVRGPSLKHCQYTMRIEIEGPYNAGDEYGFSNPTAPNNWSISFYQPTGTTNHLHRPTVSELVAVPVSPFSTAPKLRIEACVCLR